VVWIRSGIENFKLLNVGSGVGARLVLNGDLYPGDHNFAAAIGHISLAVDGP
jgi:predicted NBD/HSP70 family sugar kinase